MSATKAVFVLVHGGWHSHAAWDKVTPRLEANGFAVWAPDLPGAGVNAIEPTSLGVRPFDPAAQDRAIPLTGQDHMIAAVDRAIGGKTIIHTLDSSHSPFLSQPSALSKILLDICVRSPAEQRAQAT